MAYGYKHDLTTRSALPAWQFDMITRANIPIQLSTANDLISSDKIAPQQIGEPGEVAEPYVLDQSPDVLSIGRRCVQKGHSFNWPPYSLKPALAGPSGQIVALVSRVLYIPRRL